jgi:ribosome-associated heat shock protein Hsp15
LGGKGAPASPDAKPKERLDKWLFQARFFRSRALASDVVSAGRCRVNGQRTSKPGQGVSVGDVLTFAQAKQIRLIRIVDLAQRRGPASEAKSLYVDLNAAPSPLE